MKSVAINGFGRIGRMVFRNIIKVEKIKVVAINASYTPEQLAHLIQYDSVHGKFECEVQIKERSIIVNGNQIEIISERDPEKLPWEVYKIDCVIEATGAFRTKKANEAHLKAGAKKVIVTAPAKDDMKMIVMGVNEKEYDEECIVSNASCTTNALAPIIKTLHEAFRIKNGLVTTIHSYTNDQVILDNPHKDLRRARAAMQNILPTSTGAAKAIGEILPELRGRLNGVSIRVPTPNVSMIDLVVDVEKKRTKEEVNNILKEKSRKTSGIIDYNELPLVSSDYVSNPNSVIIDGLSTMTLENKIKILAWYDNEWGYSCRVVDLVKYLLEV